MTKELSTQTKTKFDKILTDGIITADWSKKAEFVELKAYALKKAVKLNYRYVRN
jgi:hypothetical protein